MGLRSRLGASASIGQVFLVVLNILFVLLGLGLIVIGAYIQASGAVDSRIKGLLSRVDLQGLNLGDLLVVLSGFIIVIGVFTIVVAASGGFGACLKKKALLIIYVVLLIIVCVLEIVIFAMWCNLAYGTDHWLKQQFDNLFTFYNGVTGQDDIYTRGWNLMFMLLDCCGSNRVTRFQNDFVRTYWWTNFQRGANNIPYTCCRESNVNTYTMSRNNNQQCTVNMVGQRPRGCYDAFKQLFTSVSMPFIVVSVILLVAEVIAIIAAILMIIQINRLWKQTMAPKNGSVYKHGVADLPLPDPNVH